MPYITKDRRDDLQYDPPNTAGELNYVLTMIVKDYFATHHNYQGINDIIGALEGAKLEFYRRIVAGYEDTKIEQNGDVYLPIQVGTTARLSPNNQELYDGIYGK